MMNWTTPSVGLERRARRGFTMVELMVVIAIVAIGTMLALPDLGQFMRRNRVQSATNELISAISRARVEAARTGASAGGAGTPYTVCASANSEVNNVPATPAPACIAGAAPEAWRSGAIVFADTNGDGDRDVDEILVLSIPPAPANVNVKLNSDPITGPALPYVLFAPNGKLHGSVKVARFTVSAAGFPITDSRFVCLQGGGRPTELSHAILTTDSRYDTCKAFASLTP